MTATKEKQAPKQTALAKREEQGVGLVRPLVWLSRVFPGAQIAVAVSDIQLKCRNKAGQPPSVEVSQQFLLYCAGYGVDPRIDQAYLIPFEVDGRTQWQKGLNYQVFMRFSNETGVILGAEIEPDPALWPVKYPGDDFSAKITIYRRKPLMPVTYGCRVGSVAQKYEGKLARAWADSKVGWGHMFQVTLERRGFRRAMGLGAAYGAEEFGEPEPEMPRGFEDAELVGPVEEVRQQAAQAVAEAEQQAAPAGAEEQPAAKAEPQEPPAEASPAPDATPANPFAEEEQPQQQAPPDKQAQAEGFVGTLTDDEVKTNLADYMRDRFGEDTAAGFVWVSEVLGREVKTFRGLVIADRRTLMVAHLMWAAEQG